MSKNKFCGSSPKFTPLMYYYCANSNPGKPTACDKEGKLRCSACQLVAYCSKNCQTEHWLIHKKSCKKSDLVSSNWQPDWFRENRLPSYFQIVKDNLPAYAFEYEGKSWL